MSSPLTMFSRCREKTSFVEPAVETLSNSNSTKLENHRYDKNTIAPGSRAMICNFLLRPDLPQISKAGNSTVQQSENIFDNDDWFSANFPKINAPKQQQQQPPSPVIPKICPNFTKKPEEPQEFFASTHNYIVTSDHELYSTKFLQKSSSAGKKKKKLSSYCLICRLECYGEEGTREHVNGKRHINSGKKYGCDVIMTIKDRDEYYCKCCDSRIVCFTKLWRHMESKEHAWNLSRTREKFDNENKERKKRLDGVPMIYHEDKEIFCKDTTQFCENLTSFCEKTQFSAKTTPFCEKTTPFWEITTPFCPKTTPFRDITTPSCANTPSCDDTTPFCDQTTPSCQPTITSCIYVVKRNAKKSFCQICDNTQFPVSTKKLHEHINGQRHTLSLKRYGCSNIIALESGVYHCKCCERIISNLENVYLHIKDKKHMSSLIKVNREIPVSENFQKNHENSSIIEENYQPPLQNLLSDYIVEKITRKNSTIDNHEISENKKIMRSDYTSKRTGIVFERNEIIDDERQNSNIDKTLETIQQPELSSILTSMADEVSRLFKQVEENRKARFSDKTRGNTKSMIDEKRIKNLENNVAEYTRKIFCPICQSDVCDLTQLHSHMAQHFSDEFIMTRKIRTRRNNLLNDDFSKVPNENIPCRTNGNSLICDSEEFPKINNSSVETIHNDQTSMVNQIFVRDIDEQRREETEKNSISNDDTNSELIRDTLTKEQSSPRKTDTKRLIQALNFDKDYIYDMTDKHDEMKLGLKLCLIVDSTTIYCLVCRKTVINTLQDYYEHLWCIDHCDYLETMENDNTKFSNTADQLSDLDLAQEYMQEISSKLVRCLICDEDIVNNDRTLIEHTYDKSHELLCEKMRSIALVNYEEMKQRLNCNWYGVQKYWCVPCFANMSSEVSFCKHLEGRGHAENIRKSENYGKTMLLDYCPWCALLWYGYRTTYAYHKDIAYHKWLVRDGHFAIGDLPIFAKSLIAEAEKYLDDRIVYLDEIETRERAKVERLVDDIERVARMKFLRAKAHTFGSRMTGLGTEESDVDVFLDCHNMYDGRESTESQVMYFMTGVHQCLSKDPESWDVEELLTKCRSPIIRAFHRATGLACDISFENGLAVENTKLIRIFNNVYPSCRKLIIVLKRWLEYCDLSGSERITSYALFWFVIFYLQTQSILPSVAMLIKMRKKSRIIAGWETGVTQDFTYWEPDGILSIDELLKRFFKFYATFDFRFDVACPLLGEIIKKRDFVEHWTLPEAMKPYQLYMKNTKDPEPFRIDSAMCIQDPYDLQHNITKAVSKACLNRFRTCCSKSLDLMAST